MKKFSKFICAIFVCMFAFLSVGCIGNDSNFHDELIKQLENGEITFDEFQELLKNSMSVPMYGTKVLYRPDHYDYNDSVGEGNEEYYGQYAWSILQDLYLIYGIGNKNNEYFSDQLKNLLAYTNNDYLYDSIRYNLYSQDSYIEKYVENSSGTALREGDTRKYQKENGFNQYTTLSASTINAWNWTFAPDKNPAGYIFDDEYNVENSLSYSNGIIETSYYDVNRYFNSLNTYYTNNQNDYITSYLNANSQQDIENYSGYVKALEYAIYCITMDLTPANITVTLNTDGTPNVKIGNFESVDTALTYIKEIFDKIGTYVGISTAKEEKIKDYILTNIIGANAINNDTVTIHKYRIYEYLDNGVTKTEYELIATETPIQVNRNYDAVVGQIIQDVCEYVHIGSESDDTINNRYPASEIIDYYGNNFFISSDDEFKNIKPLEYQSAVLMFSENIEVDNIMLHFKYDAGLDGDEVFDPNASITINVYINYYNHTERTYYSKLHEETITVKDGAFEYGSEGSTLCMFGIAPQRGQELQMTPFNTEMDNGILKAMDYDGRTSISNPIRLVGTTKVRNYYQLIEPSEDRADQNVYYSYGILNPNSFDREDGCDYLEIAYEVVKTTGDIDTNYKFYTGLGLIA